MYVYPPYDGSRELTIARDPVVLTRILQNICAGQIEEYMRFNNEAILADYAGSLSMPKSEEIMDQYITKIISNNY